MYAPLEATGLGPFTFKHTQITSGVLSMQKSLYDEVTHYRIHCNFHEKNFRWLNLHCVKFTLFEPPMKI